MPPTSLPKSSTSCAPTPASWVVPPERTLVGEVTPPEELCTATGARVREVGDRLSWLVTAGPTVVVAGRSADAAGDAPVVSMVVTSSPAEQASNTALRGRVVDAGMSFPR
jgi:hypothetical protein